MSVQMQKLPSGFAQYRALLKKDLAREFHTFDMLSSMALYAVFVLVVYGVALSQMPAGSDVAGIAPGLLWALIVFTSLMGLNRSFSYEKENNCLEAVLLAPLDRSVIFLAKATSNLLFLLLVEVVAVPLFCFFFLGGQELACEFALALVPLVLGTLGMAAVGTFLSTITVNTRGKDVMLAMLMIPLVFPLLYACVSATSACFAGGDAFGSMFVPAIAIIVVYDVVMSLLSWVLYDFLVSV